MSAETSPLWTQSQSAARDLALPSGHPRAARRVGQSGDAQLDPADQDVDLDW